MGGSIIEMVIVLVASALLLVQGIHEDLAHKRAALMATEGQNEAIINDALSKWVTDNYAAKLAEYTASGSTTLTPPSLSELFTQGYLKQAHRNGPFWGGIYAISMTMVPDTCMAAAGDCHVAYLMYPSLPLLKGGKSDVVGASQIAQAGGSQFGYSTQQNSATVVGLNGAWNTPNPLGNIPAAIVATNALNADGDSVYIRRDGSLTWTGSQNVNGVDLHNVGNIDATGTIAATTVAASDANVSGTSTTTNLVVSADAQLQGSATPGAACSVDRSVRTNSTTWGGLLECLGGQWWSVGLGNSSVSVGVACSIRGQGAWDINGLQYLCNGSTYRPITEFMGNSQVMFTMVAGDNNTGVSKPNCPNGTPVIELVPQTVGLDVGNPDSPFTSVRYYYSDQGSYWVPQITLIAPNGAVESGNNLGLQVLVKGECYYNN
ncbi:hypothetical protein SAMN05443245_7412 [Paraburkholderia fungorum]|uniref:Shufflon system plasmid conjugative transfer pilus tip adhesin PilV n=1 Tax=Paraburkholderia fungorum TaxID=134537 RepID=A0A1H1JW86_9BURK|nr:hypothetical protein [Paraburkholderia fungorum]SDR54371.1 hypothetical protein SAMN05443245_7412 [Paraburkholderia fungorum]